MIDREQTRRDARQCAADLKESLAVLSQTTADVIDALLIELDQAERERDEWKRLAQERIPSPYNPWVPR